MFNFLKKKKQNYSDFNKMIVDNIYLIDIPSEWNKFESDRFRVKSKNNKIQLSITNYIKKLESGNGVDIENLKSQFLPLFDKFINEGGYVSNGDLDIGENYIYQSFAVDKETQYYYYTSKSIKNLEVVIAIIIRQLGKLNHVHSNLIRKIGSSISPRVN